MSVQIFQPMSLVKASLCCVMLMVSNFGYAQEKNETDVDQRLAQLEKLEKSGLYSEQEIAQAKQELLQSIVNPAPTSSGAENAAKISRPGTGAGPTDNELYQAYRQRLEDRREQALALRREYMYYRPPARGWLAIRLPFPTTMANMFELGQVRQPPIPIPRRQYFVVPSYDADPYYGYPYYGYPYDNYDNYGNGRPSL